MHDRMIPTVDRSAICSVFHVYRKNGTRWKTFAKLLHTNG